MNELRGPHRFRTTRWTLVISAAEGGTQAARALAELCEIYWQPAYAFVRRSGFRAEDAQDLTQAFFTRVVEKGAFREADRDRGRFRSYLLACLRHFLLNARDAQQAMKRGGAFPHVSLDHQLSERTYLIEPSNDLSPERIYERRWMMAVLAQAMARLEKKYENGGRGALFRGLKGTLTGDDTASYAELSARLGITGGALRVAIHRLRKDYGTALRMTIADTVGDPGDIDDELRYLLEVSNPQSNK